MKGIPTIDLHTHTTVSDGTFTPPEMLRRVKEAGIGVFSVTDHDDMKGCLIIRDALQEGDPLFINGAEFSCRDEQGKYHILGYGFDPGSEGVLRLIEKGHGLRMRKLRERLDFLKRRFGFEFPEEEIHKLLSLDNPGKPHIGNLMVRYGYAETKEEAIRRYIDRLRLENAYVSPEEAVEGILLGGGIPVLAHPSYGSGDQLILGEEMEARILRLTEYGLKGLEAYYSGFTARLRDELLSFADRFGLYVTAGSDCHGGNKLIALGDTGLEEAEEVPEGLRRFLSDVTYVKRRDENENGL